MGLIQSNNQILFPIHITSQDKQGSSTNPYNPTWRKFHNLFYIQKDQFMPQCRTFAKRSSIPTIPGFIQSSHIDQTNPCSNTKTPILSKFSPCSPFLSQLVTAHSHRLARTTNPFSTLYCSHPYSACILLLLFFPKTYPSLLLASLLKLPSRVFGAW